MSGSHLRPIKQVLDYVGDPRGGRDLAGDREVLKRDRTGGQGLVHVQVKC